MQACLEGLQQHWDGFTQHHSLLYHYIHCSSTSIDQMEVVLSANGWETWRKSCPLSPQELPFVAATSAGKHLLNLLNLLFSKLRTNFFGSGFHLLNDY